MKTCHWMKGFFLDIGTIQVPIGKFILFLIFVVVTKKGDTSNKYITRIYLVNR